MRLFVSLFLFCGVMTSIYISDADDNQSVSECVKYGVARYIFTITIIITGLFLLGIFFPERCVLYTIIHYFVSVACIISMCITAVITNEHKAHGVFAKIFFSTAYVHVLMHVQRQNLRIYLAFVGLATVVGTYLNGMWMSNWEWVFLVLFSIHIATWKPIYKRFKPTNGVLHDDARTDWLLRNTSYSEHHLRQDADAGTLERGRDGRGGAFGN